MPPAVVLVTGVSRWLGGALAAELAADPVDRAGHRRGHRPAVAGDAPPARAHRVRAGRHPQPADRQGHRGGVGRHGRAHEHQLHARRLRRAGADEGTQRHRHDAAAGRVPAGAVGAPVRAEVDQRRLRRLVARPRRLHREDAGAARCPPAGSPRTASTSRATSAPSRGAVPTSTSLSLRFTNFIGPGSTRCSPASSACPSCRRRSATTPACSCCTRTTPWRCSTRATTGDFVGTVNVGGEGTLLLSQAIRRLGRIEVPLPTPALGRSGGSRAASASSTTRPSRCASSTSAASSTPRCCATEFGYTPRYTTEAALADYARTVPPVVSPGWSGRRPAGVRSVARPGRRRRPPRSASGCGPAPPAPGLRAVRDA